MFPDKNYQVIDYKENLHQTDLILLEGYEGDYLFPSGMKQPEIKLIKYAEKIIGYVEYVIILDEMEIYRILVADDWRGRGGATFILSHLFKYYSQVKKIHLEVSSRNKSALALYIKLGFKEVGLRIKYYKDGSDAILMTKNVFSS
ncbi:MAG: ribosomal-protein-alanine acetyltransferase [uncultured bacterium]|nr:MAG: ribosomal-protein-alanine acetyltransferase [uncultured bacterium]